MREFLKVWTVILTLFIVTVMVQKVAANDEPPSMPEELAGYQVEMGFEWFPTIPNHLFFVGSILQTPEGERSQVDVLLEFLEDHPEIHTVVLHSGGGSVRIGASMARVIHERKFTTYVPKGGSCLSACGYMWLAGKVRVLDGELGAHQIAVGQAGELTTTVGEMYQEVQQSMGNLMAWMYDYEVPVLYYAWMLLTPSDEMHIFNDEEEAELVTGEDQAYFDVVDDFVEAKYSYLRSIQEWREGRLGSTPH